MRSGYFIDSLKSRSGLGFERLERRIRENQYEANNIRPPCYETVRDYFALKRSVVFEPHGDDGTAPWLFAAEQEFPGASTCFFHPLFDQMFGQLESAYFWRAKFSRIPQEWIDGLRVRGRSFLADEWEAMNLSLQRRKHRTQPKTHLDRLSLLHLSMLRLPDPIRDQLFTKDSAGSPWRRLYEIPIEDFLANLRVQISLEAIAALLALVEESAEIGDFRRYACAKQALEARYAAIPGLPGCKRVGKAIQYAITSHLEGQVFPRSYNGTLMTGFGLPISWRTILQSELIAESQGPTDERTGG